MVEKNVELQDIRALGRPELRAVSYAYSTWPVTPLYSAAGIPAVPFFANVTEAEEHNVK